MSSNIPIPVTFRVYKGSQLLQTTTLNKNIIKIGKLPSSHLCIDDESISRIHAVIEHTGPEEISIVDLGSTRGTLINGRRSNKEKLQNGDEITLGDIRILITFNEVLVDEAAQQTDLNADPKFEPELRPINSPTQNHIGGFRSLVLFLIVSMLSYVFREYIFVLMDKAERTMAIRAFLLIIISILTSFTVIKHKRSALVEIPLSLFTAILFYGPIVVLFFYMTLDLNINYAIVQFLSIFCIGHMVLCSWIMAIRDHSRPSYGQRFLAVILNFLFVSATFISLVAGYLEFFIAKPSVLESYRGDIIPVMKTEIYIVSIFLLRLLWIGVAESIRASYGNINLIVIMKSPNMSLAHLVIYPIRIAALIIINIAYVFGKIMLMALKKMTALLKELLTSKHAIAMLKVIATFIVVSAMVYLSNGSSQALSAYLDLGSRVRTAEELQLIANLAWYFLLCWVLIIIISMIWTEQLRPTLDECIYETAVLQLSFFACGTYIWVKANIFDIERTKYLGTYLIAGWIFTLIVGVWELLSTKNRLRAPNN